MGSLDGIDRIQKIGKQKIRRIRVGYSLFGFRIRIVGFYHLCQSSALTGYFLYIWRPKSEPDSRRDEGAMPLHCNRGATQKPAGIGPPRRGSALLGCDFVTRPRRIAEDTPSSSFLVSLQNRRPNVQQISGQGTSSLLR